ncbi:hypothetical protein COO60DRAFT_1538509 [Scenedesmus sp. NREL 46B-D3]|nr:hypothetical protein COO60DRAFT_1538509 [Scenedesmus sp. NREL 46B-D3]
MAALCGLTALRSLGIYTAGQAVSPQSDRVLVPLSALRQLTTLQLLSTGAAPRKEQLQSLQLPQLQQLQAALHRMREGKHLQLAHLTALTQLSLTDSTGVPSPTDQLPPNLLDLTWLLEDWYGSVAASSSSCSVQPLLALSRLRKLQLHTCATSPTAEELAQLSSLGSLTELGIVSNWQTLGHEEDEADVLWQTVAAQAAAEPTNAAVLRLLPLKALSWSSERSPVAVAVLQHLGALQGLTRLELHLSCEAVPGHCGNQLTPAELTAMLQRSTGLQQLSLTAIVDVAQFVFNIDNDAGDFVVVGYDVDAVAAFLRAVGGLK